jgi:hypothetical protein
MLLAAATVLIIAATVYFTFGIRPKDVPPPEKVSPTDHLEQRKAAIYENLRDLQFEYRVGKLSDADYQQTKLGLQKELTGVLAEIERVQGGGPATVKPPAQPAAAAAPAGTLCPHCGAAFASPMKFCGECGKEMV